MIAVRFYSIFRNRVLAKITERFVHSKDFFNTELEKIFEKISGETTEILRPVMEQICSDKIYLDFTDSSKKDYEEKLDSYYRCMDYSIDIMTLLIQHTL